jgi:DNA-nicking Smr family endonuclease
MPRPIKRPHLKDDELFRVSVSDVTPLPKLNRARIEPRRPGPIPAQRLKDNEEALKESLSEEFGWDLGRETGEELVFLREGVPSDMLSKLRRGHWVIQDELDLHYMRSHEARKAVVEFLNDCVRDGFRCVRVIHGKGLRSKNQEPVLKRKVGIWLLQRNEVLAYCQARLTEGGSGALMVLLKGGR